MNQPAPEKAYVALLEDLKGRIHSARLRASLAVNSELVVLYWSIGKEILTRQATEGWGAKVIGRLSTDLRAEFPESSGFSARNLKYMRAFAEAWPEEDFVQEVLAQLPWFSHLALLDKLDGHEERTWYARRAIAHGWSRNVLVHQIEGQLMDRQGQAQTNFAANMPAPTSDLAQELLKDPYQFDFLGLDQDIRERGLERALLARVKDFLLELGAGFAFVGSQYHLEVGGQDYYLDLLFYHLHLRSFVVIELKVGPFVPEFAGKMNFYLAAVDESLKAPQDGPSIGIILCKEKNQVIVEYALRDQGRPIGVATYRLKADLPKDLRDGLPSVEDFARSLASDEANENSSSKKDNEQ